MQHPACTSAAHNERCTAVLKERSQNASVEPYVGVWDAGTSLSTAVVTISPAVARISVAAVRLTDCG